LTGRVVDSDDDALAIDHPVIRQILCVSLVVFGVIVLGVVARWTRRNYAAVATPEELRRHQRILLGMSGVGIVIAVITVFVMRRMANL